VGNRTAPVADTTATPGQTVQATPIARASLANLAPLAGPAAIDGFGQLLQRVSHELRTPLNAVIGFSDLMQREMLGPLGDARYVEYAGHIRSSGSELLKATEDTLALTTLMGRADAPRRDVYPLANLMQDVGTRVGARPAHHAALVDVTVDRDCEVMVDRRVLVQAIVNVTSALLRHAPAGTSVTIAAIERADTVELRVMPSRPASGEVRDALEMCLARTLLVLAGLGMSEDHATGDCMGIIVHVPAAAQSDLFDAPVARS
jgi:signal transduction histidine kinase